ncbi:WD40 repeat domain-containing protein [Rubripirellula reticaptiva]|nr:WD40 repeat domain-containing protein [Rubripirellula reticaptiva]
MILQSESDVRVLIRRLLLSCLLIALIAQLVQSQDSEINEIQVGDYVRFELRGNTYQGPVIQATTNGRLLIVDVSVDDRKSRRQVKREACVRLTPAEMNSVFKPVPPASKSEPIELTMPTLAEPGEGEEIALTNEQLPSVDVSSPTVLDWSGFQAGKRRINKVPFDADPDLPYVLDISTGTVVYSVASDHSTDIFVSTDRPSDYRLVRIKNHTVRIADTLPQHGVALGLIRDETDHDKGLCVITGLSTGQPRVASAWSLPKQKVRPLYCHYRRLLPDGSVVCVYENTLRVFDGRDGRLCWHCPVPAFFEPAVSQGGRWLAIAANGRLFVVEASTGRCAGSIPNLGKETMQPCFSPDGKMLAVYGENRMVITRINDGRVVLDHQANVDLAPFGGESLWTAPAVLVTPGGYLMDLRKNMLVWKYQLPADVNEWMGAPESGWIPIINDDWLSFVRIPHQDVTQLSAAVDQNALVAIQAGDSLRIEVEIKDDVRGDVDAFKANLTKALESSGYRQDISAEALLKAEVVRAAERTDHYINFGTGKTESITYRPFGARVTVVHRGEELWSANQAGNLNYHIAGGLQRAAKQLEQPPANLFQTMQLPRRFLSKKFQNGLGKSSVSIDGVK